MEKYQRDCLRTSHLAILELSNNKLHGEVLSRNLSFGNIRKIYLNSNCFTGEIENETSKMSTFSSLNLLDISNNHFTGLIPHWISNSTLSQLVVRNNRFGGQFPCGIASFWFLDISQNYFSGPIPWCSNFQNLAHLHFGSNKFTGSIPNSFRNLSRVLTLAIGNNILSGKIPEFLGELSNLRILQLRKNKFSGSIPNQLCKLTNVSLIDLSSNSLSGPIPRCLQNITSPIYHAFMQRIDATFSRSSLYSYMSVLNKEFDIHDEDNMLQTQDEVMFTTKNLSLIYKGEILDMISGLDLSCNKLSGDILEELGMLTQIRLLNLSHNVLTGPIPLNLSYLTKIESLDLSSNGLTGKVPTELIELKFLAIFNVSYNNLSGRLPEMKAQFNTFTKDSYEGNPLLCGLPLENKCTNEPHVTYRSNEEESDEKWYDIDMTSFYGSFGSTWFVLMAGFTTLLYINRYRRRRWLDLVEECMYTCYYFFYDLVRKPYMLFLN
ncbi:hypothetical protein L1987_30775 [Smallanthus sonchifolius]|uniref:Uncharacterized protein n=1 Tax=Smallanthus sonchifolius TaxID=185202 RepID=A0ACB9I3R2_9ASTR|nr:hypothetical protein L1987_30775 [Smallanthus sonchifolius]